MHQSAEEERRGIQVERGNCMNKIFFCYRLSDKTNGPYCHGWQLIATSKPLYNHYPDYLIFCCVVWSLTRRLQSALSVLPNKLILLTPVHPPSLLFPLNISVFGLCDCVCVCVSMCAWSVGVNNVHYIVAIPNVLVSHLGLPWGVCPYPRTYSWYGFNKHCRCEAIESLQDCSQWQFRVPHRVQMSSANITGALNLCQWQQEGLGAMATGCRKTEFNNL